MRHALILVAVLMAVSFFILGCAASPPFLLGAVLSLVQAHRFWTGPKRRRKLLLSLTDQPLEVVKQVLKVERTALLALALLALGSTGFLVAILLSGTETPTTEVLWANTVLVGCLGGSLFIGSKVWALRDLSQAPVVRLLREQPEQAVWFCRILQPSRDIHQVFLGFAAGTSFRLRSFEEPVELLQALRALCPNTARGYSEEALLQWTTAPQNMHAAFGLRPR